MDQQRLTHSNRYVLTTEHRIDDMMPLMLVNRHTALSGADGRGHTSPPLGGTVTGIRYKCIFNNSMPAFAQCEIGYNLSCHNINIFCGKMTTRFYAGSPEANVCTSVCNELETLIDTDFII